MSSGYTPAPKLTNREKACYGGGAMAFALAYSALGNLAMPIFNIEFGMSATLVGLALALGRGWDAITDPLMGSFSDNARTRWGRRRPFILLGGFLCALTFPLFWFMPLGWDEWSKFYWLLGCIILYYTATTVLSVPYLSLGYEMNPDPIERTRLQAWNAWFVAVVSIGVPWIYPAAQDKDFFGTTQAGIQWIGSLCGLLFILCTLPVFFGCRERLDRTALQQEKVPFWKGLKETLSNRPFVLLVLGVVTTLLAVPVLVGSLAVYINSYYIFAGDTVQGAKYAAAYGTVYFASKFVILPFTVKLVARYGKLRVIKTALVVGMIGAASQFFLYTPALPWLQFGCALLLSPALTCFWLLVNPMKADCADYDEWQTGHRRSGSYAAVANWMEKMAMTIFLFGSGVLLDLSGFKPELGANQPEHTTLIWRIAFSGVPMLAYGIALFSLSRYPLTDAKMAQIRAELDARSQAAS